MGLLVLVTAGSALGGYAISPRARVSVLKLDFPPVPVAFSPVPSPAISVEPRRPESKAGLGAARSSWLFHGCGHSSSLQVMERKSDLPDPVSALGAAFLKCRAVKAEALDPRVPVSRYPEGYFGDWVDDGVLVTERVEFTDEERIRQVFALLVEAVGDPDVTFDDEIEMSGFQESVANYRQDTGFVPELIFEFAGAVPLRFEINVSQHRLLVQAGDKWGGYTLDRWSATALQELLTASASSGS